MLFRPEYIATVGADVITRIYEFNKQTAYLLIFDIRGESIHDTVNDYFFSGASAALIAFDLTRRETFNNVGEWTGEVRKRIPYPIPMSLLGNKADLQEKRVVKLEEAKRLASDIGIGNYLETSAKTTENVNKAFMEIIARCFIEGPKDSRLGRNVEEVVANIHPADEELISEVKKLDSIGRKNIAAAKKP
jgi:GTPase SAR1 family protein